MHGIVDGTATGSYNADCNEGCIGIEGSASIALEGTVGGEVEKFAVAFQKCSSGDVDDDPAFELKEAKLAAEAFLGSLGIVGGVSKGDGCGSDGCTWTIGEGKIVFIATGGSVTIWGFKVYSIEGYEKEIELWKERSGSCF